MMKKILLELKRLFDKYPITYIILFFTSLLCICDVSFLDDIIFRFLLPFGLVTLLIETIDLNKKNKLYYLIPFFSGIMIYILTIFDVICNNSWFIRILIFIYLSILLLVIYYDYTHLKKNFSEYLISCFSNLLKVLIITFILCLGFLLLFLLFNVLIYDFDFYDMYFKLIILLFGIYFFPACIYSFYEYSETSTFVNILVSKIMFTLLLISYLIIYIYIFKIIFSLTIPSNVIFRILSLLFVISFFINTMSLAVEKNLKVIKIHQLLLYLFIPFILLQVYSLGIRIVNNGFTITRYLGIILIIFEIFYIIFSIRKKDLSLLVYVSIFELFITLIVPYINCYNISIQSQYNILLKYKENKMVNEKLQSSYYYLLNFDKGKELIDNLLTEKEQEALINYKFTPEVEKYYYYNQIKSIDISGYDTLDFISEDNSKFEIIIDKINSCVNGNNSDCFENNDVILINNKKIIINYVNYSSNNYYLEYYLLSKNE